MNNQAPDGGGGKYSVYDLSIAEIDQASLSDYDKVSEMESRRDGWAAYRNLMADMKADLEAELPNLIRSFDSPAGRVFAESLTMMADSIENHHEIADSNKESSDSVIAEVKRVRPLIEEIMDDRRLAVEHRNELQAMEQEGSDAYSNALDDTLAEARRTFSESNSSYSSSHVRMIEPPPYTGPKYTGPGPQSPLDDGYRYGYHPDRTPYRGENSAQGFGGSSAPGSSGSSTAYGQFPSGGDGPQLQGPGSTAPTTSAAPIGIGPGAGPVAGGSSGSPTPTYPPGSAVLATTGPGTNPLPPNGSHRTTPPVNQARPTPGMNRPLTGNTGPRPSAPASGHGASGGTPKSSLLPNQRQAQAGRTPVTGSRRMPAGPAGNGRTATGSGARGVTPVRQGAVPSSERGGIVRGRPNAGFEENLYRDARARRTVPGVVNGARENMPGGRPAGSQSRTGATERVFRQRSNKGKDGGPMAQRLQSGTLTDPAKRKKDTRHTWQRMPVKQSTQPLVGSVALVRNGGGRRLTPDEIADAKLQARKQWRRRIYTSLREPRLEPASELFGGTEGKVTRAVIRGAGVSRPVERREAGTRFSTFGWENER